MINVILGRKYEDRITGFKGIAESRTQYLNGCDRIGLKPKMRKDDSKPASAQFFDDVQLKEIGKGVEIQGSKNTGGPRQDPY